MKPETAPQKMDICTFTQTLHKFQGGYASAPVSLRLSILAPESTLASGGA